MNSSIGISNRVLAVDPSPRGLGFVILEGPQSLIEWGVREVRAKKKNAGTLREMESLIESYEPDVVVIEDCGDKECSRGPRVRHLIQKICKLSTSKRVKIRRFSVRTVRAVLSGSPTSTKHQIATIVAMRFPELVPRLPALRKPWMSETYRTDVFDAMALALTFFSNSQSA